MNRVLARLRRHLHWWTAGLIAAGFAIAWVMTALPMEALFIKFLLYQAHKSIGLIVLAIVLVRLGLVLGLKKSLSPAFLALYALLLAVPLLGYFTAAAAPTDVPTLFLLLLWVPHLIRPSQAAFDVLAPLHEWLAIGLVALAVVHGVSMRRRARTPRRAAA